VYLRPLFTDFNNSFSGTFFRKFAVKRSLKISPTAVTATADHARVRTEENEAVIDELVLSQEDQPQIHR